jgi:outer membrane protein assembly factor BamB
MDRSLRSRLALAALAALAMSGVFTNTPGDAKTGSTPAKLTQATFGGGTSRNMVNLVDKNVPITWNVDPAKQQNIKWVADVGKRSWGGPVIYDGRVFVGTNNDRPRDPKVKGKMAVVMCFAEKDGNFLWQNGHGEPPEPVDQQGVEDGMCSTPTVEGKFVYYCTPGVEVICARTEDGKIVWRKDLMKELKVFPLYLCACSPLVVGDRVFVVTGNGTGTDDQGKFKVMAPQAPSFVALSKSDGKVLWHKNYPGGNLIEGQWSSAVYAEPGGKPQVIFPGGDDYLYGLEPATGEIIWKFNCRPPAVKEETPGITPFFMSTPVVWDNKVYVGLGAVWDTGRDPRLGHFFCVDITKKGDVSCKNQNFGARDPADKDSALVWYFGSLLQPKPAKGRPQRMQATVSTAAVHDGLVYIVEERGYVHCLDAKTGQRYWEHDTKSSVLGSTYWVDGKIYLGTQSGDINILEHGTTYKAPRQVEMDEGLKSTPVVANGVLYITTPNKVYAISAGK